MLTVLAIAGLACAGRNVLAQGSLVLNGAQPAAAGTVAPQLAYGVPQVLQLVQAKIGDSTIIAYIRNSGTSYGLNADQIIYLRQQGVSDAVLTAMLQQPRPGTGVAMPSTPAPQPVAAPASYPAQDYSAAVAPSESYGQTVPATTYYYQPYDYYPYYYPYGYWPYGWNSGITFYYGGGWHGGGHYGGWHGGGWHGGGYYGGWHGGSFGGGWHGTAPGGGWHTGVPGGGFHGGGSAGNGHGGGHR
jgi:uncharacterized membrane protein YgcG